jgi:hypothetical protein
MPKLPPPPAFRVRILAGGENLAIGRHQGRIDSDAPHRREADHEAAFAERVTADAVAAGARRYKQVSLAGEANRGDDIGDSPAAGDVGGPAVDRSVPDRARGVVDRVGGQDHRAANAGAQALDFDRRRLRGLRPKLQALARVRDRLRASRVRSCCCADWAVGSPWGRPTPRGR